MSEVMALERLAELWLKFESFWTEARVPFKKPSGANSDIDVIGICLSEIKPKVVVIEVKGHGSPSAYHNLNSPGQRRKIKKLCAKERRDIALFLRASRAGKPKSFAERMGIERVDEVRLIEPGHFGKISRKDREDFERELKREYRLSFDLKIYSVHEVIGELRDRVKIDKDFRRKRYADTASEMIRWILRAGGDIKWPTP